mgnify:CR=1 FL=1
MGHRGDVRGKHRAVDQLSLHQHVVGRSDFEVLLRVGFVPAAHLGADDAGEAAEIASDKAQRVQRMAIGDGEGMRPERDIAITSGESTFTFPARLNTGDYIEFWGNAPAKIFSATGLYRRAQGERHPPECRPCDSRGMHKGRGRAMVAAIPGYSGRMFVRRGSGRTPRTTAGIFRTTLPEPAVLSTLHLQQNSDSFSPNLPRVAMGPEFCGLAWRWPARLSDRKSVV